MVATGLAFKTSLAPFHQWTPDVYQGAPTPVTAFMAVATKAAAFIALARLFEVALGPIAHDWKPALAAIAVISIAIGNIGALGQDSLKRLMGYSGIAQAGYMLAGVVVATEKGLEALVFYLAAYTLMNLAVFAVVVARERETDRGDDIESVAGHRPLAPAARLAAHHRDARAGRPARHLGLHGQALPDRGDRGRRLHLARRDHRDRLDGLPRLLPAGARGRLDEPGADRRPGPAHARDRWGRAGPTRGTFLRAAAPASDSIAPASDSGAATLGTGRCPLIFGSALLCAAATVAFGIAPSPLIDWASHAAESLATTLA